MNKNLSRREFVRLTVASAAGIAWANPLLSAAEKPKRPPNILLILIDDMGYTDLGCYGSRYYETPNIDRLASQGMRFTDGYAACAVCSPTRSAVMTGRYPARLGITDWIRSGFQGGKIPADRKNPSGYESVPKRRLRTPANGLWMELEERTIAEALKPAGYVSAHIGKWHLGFTDWYPDKQGFDVNIGGCDFGQPPSYFDPYSNSQQKTIHNLPPRHKGEYLTDREADEAVGFIRANANRPFFLYLAHYGVHTPLMGKPDLVDHYTKKPKTHQNNPVYAAMVQSVDDATGKVMKALDDLGLADNTLVIFTSDNGGLMGKGPWNSTSNLPLRAGKGYPYEGGIREPLIVRWPKVVAAGTTCDVPVCSIDFFPTVCEAAKVTDPGDRPIDGMSLFALLTRTGKGHNRDLFWHFPHYRGEDVGPYGIIRSGHYKLIRWYEDNRLELYNLQDDLSETANLVETMPEMANELNRRLSEWLKEVGAKMPIANPDFKST